MSIDRSIELFLARHEAGLSGKPTLAEDLKAIAAHRERLEELEDAARWLAERKPTVPGPMTVATIPDDRMQDRNRQLLLELGFDAVDTPKERSMRFRWTESIAHFVALLNRGT
jgi:hypothetical protein